MDMRCRPKQHGGLLRMAPASAPPAGSTARAHTAPPSESLTARGRRCARSHSTSSPAEGHSRPTYYMQGTESSRKPCFWSTEMSPLSKDQCPISWIFHHVPTPTPPTCLPRAKVRLVDKVLCNRTTPPGEHKTRPTAWWAMCSSPTSEQQQHSVTHCRNL